MTQKACAEKSCTILNYHVFPPNDNVDLSQTSISLKCPSWADIQGKFSWRGERRVSRLREIQLQDAARVVGEVSHAELFIR